MSQFHGMSSLGAKTILAEFQQSHYHYGKDGLILARLENVSAKNGTNKKNLFAGKIGHSVVRWGADDGEYC